MTEDEAFQRWCPFALRNGDNRSGTGGQLISTQCIGSACMAWRWGQKPNPDYNPNQGVMWPQPRPPVPMYVRDETTGGCGLAGSVQ